jgi:serine acetyltransferase
MKLSQYFESERAAVVCWFHNFVINFLPDFWIVNNCLRPALARLCGMKCGSRVALQKGIFYGNPNNVSIGNRSVICRGSFLDGFDKITIGNNVAISFQVTFISSTHEMGTKEMRMGGLFGNPIVIGDGVWIAARAIIGPGTEIGAGSMISAGAAVMSSVPANSLVAGVPGKVITQLESGLGSGRLREPAATYISTNGQEDISAAPEGTALESTGNHTMTRQQFYSELESLLEMERGSIHGTEWLSGLSHWSSLTRLAFIAMADTKLHEVASPSALAQCKTVADLANLFPGKIN